MTDSRKNKENKRLASRIIDLMNQMTDYREDGCVPGYSDIREAMFRKTGWTWDSCALDFKDRMDDLVDEDEDETSSEGLFDEAVPREKLKRDIYVSLDDRGRRYVAHCAVRGADNIVQDDYTNCIDRNIVLTDFFDGCLEAGYKNLSAETLGLLMPALVEYQANKKNWDTDYTTHIEKIGQELMRREKENQDAE